MAKRTIKKFGQITDELPGKVKKKEQTIFVLLHVTIYRWDAQSHTHAS